ncbi:MAG TPA: UDP-glucose/GDP-mannose dehydrogenase family protein [Terriglobales bacterium]|nr:UDP-glucose/GDP-mannose dehydrogenase family protein [Terriglobales bacterium]
MGLSISVFGLGYVGSVSAACFASMGHRVMGVDVSRAKVELLDSGRSPIVEAKVQELVAAGNQACRLHATTDPIAAVLASDVSFVCVGTPSLRNGKLDLRHIETVSREIGAAIKRKPTHHTFVLRSTVLPGTTESVVIPILESASGKRAGVDFTVCYNPEFMREGTAVADFMQPPYTILGCQNPEHLAPLRELYQSVPGRVFETTITVAEMAKYLSNAFHAVKVSFANEVGTLCKHLGVDAQAVTEIFTADTRLNISPAYLSPGFAFGGSCLPKDVRAINYRAKELDLHLPLLESILPSNAEHIDRALEAVLRSNKRKIAQLGLSFKAGTDDLRESPQVQLIKRLLGEGCEVRIWDQEVSLGRLVGSNRQYIEEVIPHIGSLLSGNLQEVVSFAEVVIIGNKSVDKAQLSECLRPDQVVIDLVHLDKSRRVSGVAQYEGICW